MGQNHPVTMKDGFFYLNGKKFFVKGLGIEIGRPGEINNSPATYNPKWFRFDVQRMLSAGYNTVRTWYPCTEAELEAVKDLDIKIIMGLGLGVKNNSNNSRSIFIDSSLQVVKDILSYSKNYDNIIAYLITNEPSTEDIMKDYSSTQLLFKTIVNEIHSQQPGTSVSISAFPNTSYLNMDVFDFAGFNVHPGTNSMQDSCYDYTAYIDYLKQVHGITKPLVVAEYGVSVSPIADNSRFPGSTQEERQTNGLLYMYRSLIDGGAGGGCTFINADGWWKGGDPNVHDNDPQEWYGLIAYQSLTDSIGTPRPAWYAIQKYNTAVITAPLNEAVYQNKIPVEIFGSDTIDHFTVDAGGSELLSAKINENYYADTILLNNIGMQDTALLFTFYDKDSNVVKEETIVCLTSDNAIVLPKLKVTSPQTFLNGTGSITVNYDLTNNPEFKTGGVIHYVSDPIVAYDYNNATYDEPFVSNNNHSFSETYGSHFNSGVDIMSYMNTAVLVFSAGVDVSYGNFKKRITGHTILCQDTAAYTTIPARIEAEECKYMSAMPSLYPYVVNDVDGWWAISSSNPGDWLEYYINVPTARDYKFNIRYAATSTNIITINDDTLSYNIKLPVTGDLQTWASKDTDIQFSGCEHKLIFETNSGGLGINWFSLSTPTDIKSLYSYGDIIVSPNPVVNHTLTVTLPESSKIGENYQIEIYDVNGKICYSSEMKNNEDNRLFIHLSNSTNNGLYLLHIINEENCYSQKIIVQ